MIVYESIDDATEEDADKVRGRGGYFTKNDMLQILTDLVNSGKYRVSFIRPQIFDLNKTTLNRVEPILRQVDVVCFFVEENRISEK